MQDHQEGMTQEELFPEGLRRYGKDKTRGVVGVRRGLIVNCWASPDEPALGREGYTTAQRLRGTSTQDRCGEKRQTPWLDNHCGRSNVACKLRVLPSSIFCTNAVRSSATGNMVTGYAAHGLLHHLRPAER